MIGVARHTIARTAIEIAWLGFTANPQFGPPRAQPPSRRRLLTGAPAVPSSDILPTRLMSWAPIAWKT